MPNSYFRTAPGRPTRDFHDATHRALHRRSAELRAADDAVDAYLAAADAAGLRRVVNTLATWRSAHPGDFRRRCDPLWPQLHGQLRMEALRYPDFIECLDEIAVPPPAAQALAWVRAVDTADELQQFSTYACLDATTFAACIRGDNTPAGPVRTREAAWNAGHFPPFGTNAAMALVGPNRSWDERRLRTNYTRIRNQGGRGAVCTTFGYLSAYVLTHGRPAGPRVELVSYPRGRGSHVFVIVGRRGGLTAGGRLPNDWDGIVVDAWAAALGHHCIFPNRAAFPFAGMTADLELVMQRPAS